MRRLTAVLSLLLVACATSPYPQAARPGSVRAGDAVYPVWITSIDGNEVFAPPESEISVEPGPHWIVAVVDKGGESAVPTWERTVHFDLPPCTRAVFAGDRPSPILDQWTLLLLRREAIAPCNRTAGTSSAAVVSFGKGVR